MPSVEVTARDADVIVHSIAAGRRHGRRAQTRDQRPAAYFRRAYLKSSLNSFIALVRPIFSLSAAAISRPSNHSAASLLLSNG
jgi:hypothetical protein